MASYNSTGLGKDKMEYIKYILDKENVDILYLQETWLLPSNIQKLGCIHEAYLYHGVSAVDNKTLLMGRPYSGVGILYKKSLSKLITKVNNIA